MPILPFQTGLGAGESRTLLGAIEHRFATSTVLSAAFTAIWYSHEPEDPNSPPALPYVIYTHEGEDSEWNSEQEVIKTTRIQFQVYAAAAEDLEALARKIENRFDWGPGYDLKIIGAQTVDATEPTFRISKEDLRDQNDNVIYQGLLDYVFITKWNPVFDRVGDS